VCQIDILQRLKCERHVIEKTLKSLPKTLYETYDVIIQMIPDEDHLFVHHVLQWIQLHGEISDVRGITCELLLKVVENSMKAVTGSEVDRFYDINVLRELCGCFIQITKEELRSGYYLSTISFAHYTVREYHETQSLGNFPKCCSAVLGENLKKKLIEMTFSESLKAKMIKISEESSQDNGECLIDVIEKDFMGYSLYSTLSRLRNEPNEVSQDETLFSLAANLLNPSRPHYPALVSLCCHFEQALGSFSNADWERPSHFWLVRHEHYSDENTIILLNFLMIAFSNPDALVLAEKLLQRARLSSLLKSRSVLQMPDGEGYDCLYEGSIIELFAQLPERQPEFHLLLEHGTGLYNPSKILLLFSTFHFYDHDVGCTESCLVERLVDLGADPAGAGYNVTPLQIATWNHDIEGVRVLLGAGAPPNGTGDPNGLSWGEGTSMPTYNMLEGASPLHICKMVSKEAATLFGHEIRHIEKLLLQYGAEEILRTRKSAV
jgi:hypothetical protein